MFKRKLMMLAGLVLSFAVLNRRSASANAEGTDRPWRAISATISLNVLTGAPTVDGRGSPPISGSSPPASRDGDDHSDGDLRERIANNRGRER